MESTSKKACWWLFRHFLSIIIRIITQIRTLLIQTGDETLYCFIRLICMRILLIIIRWSPENKSKLNSYAYMPFGMGPRNCVGMRFALEEIKITLCSLVQHFRFFAIEETPVRKKLVHNFHVNLSYCIIALNLFQDKIHYEDGFLQVAQPNETPVGIEMRNWILT